MEVNEQPTAPYLEAVVAYAFRGPGRFHVPGHKGGPGADPGLRKAIGVDALAADVPQDIPGIDVGPPPTPYDRAEQLAAEAYGAARTFFLTNGATQGNHALCLALAPLGAHVVAQAWGPHFGFHEALPPSALAQGADAVLASTHKIVGSLTQSAMLHLADGTRLDEGAVARAVRLLRSTSPSSLLLASLDGARRQLALHGEQILHETLLGIGRAREKLAGVEGVALVDDALVGRPGVAAYDPLRIVLDVRGTGATGY